MVQAFSRRILEVDDGVGGECDQFAVRRRSDAADAVDASRHSLFPDDFSGCRVNLAQGCPKIIINRVPGDDRSRFAGFDSFIGSPDIGSAVQVQRSVTAGSDEVYPAVCDIESIGSFAKAQENRFFP